jgi:putative ABC transport system ATP-binding protein
MIELEGINRNFEVGEETVHALRDINLNIEAGEYISIMGPSGSGKSTLLNILGLLDQPNSGSYRFNDKAINQLAEDEQAQVRRENIGFVFQFFHLIPRLSAADNVALPLTLAGVEPEIRQQKTAAAMNALGIAERAQHRPDQLSGGQRQRVAIARAMITEPQLILADEPTGNLDRSSGNDVIEALEALNQKGITLIMVTHDPELGERARRRLKMDDGKIIGDHQS